MASAIKVFQVGISDLGVVPRDKSVDDLSVMTQDEHYKKNNIALIRLDENNEYNLTESLIVSIPDGELYDKDIKILEWHYGADGCLIVESYTDKQINLFADLKVKKCLISAKGSLFIKGKLECESTIAIDAEALWLAESLKSSGDIVLAVRQGVGLLAPINAQHLVITAAYVHQEADLQLSGQLDISTQCFKQESSVNMTVNSLRLIASECQMRGDLTVNKECFLTAGALILGHEEGESTFRLLGNNHIHARNVHIQGDTQVRIGHLDNNKEGNFIVDEDLLIDELAIVDVFNTELSANEVDNQGELTLNQSTTNVKIIQQQGIFNAEQSLIVASQRLIHQQQAVTELKNTNLTSPKIDILGEKFSLDNCNYKGQLFNVSAGFVEFKNQSEIELDMLWLLKKASLSIKDSSVSAYQSFQASGEIFFENVDLKAKIFKTIENRAIIKHSKIRAQTQIKLGGTTELADSRLSGEIMTLKGDLTVSAVRLNANALEIISEHATINSLSVFSKKLHLQGSKKAEQVILKRSVLTTEQFSCVDHATLELSLVYGVSKELVSHNLQAHFKVRSSKFITESQLSNHAGGRIELEEHSAFRVGMLHSQGAMKAKDSKVTCEILWQENASLKLESSTVQVNKVLHTQASKLTLKSNSIVLAPVVQLLQCSTLKLQAGSTLSATSSVATSADSTINSNNSTILTKKFIALGRTELCTSLLAAEELHIYEQFEANIMSKVTVEKLINVAKEARAKLSDSTIVSNNIQIAGKMVVSDSIVATKNTLSVWSPATMTLEGNSLVSAEDMVVRGTLETQNKAKRGEQNEKTENQGKQASQLKVNGKLHIAKCATVKGTADLFIEADQYLHSGSMNLHADLRARGGRLNNYGSLNAESIYLGFDDKVVNFGSFSAKDMTVHSNFINFTGAVYADKSLSIAGFYGLNFGLISANNYSNTTLLSVNGGLVVPNFSADPVYIFSLNNFVSVGKIAINTIAPSYSNAINLAFMAPSLAKSASLAYDTYESFSWDRYHSMRRHEWMAQSCQFKGLVSAAWSTFDAAYATSGEFSNLGTDLPAMVDWMFDSNTYSFRTIKAAAEKTNWQRLGTRTAGVFLGNYSDNALIDINLGASIAPSTSKKALFSVNAGVEASLLTHTVDSNFFYNSGVSAGGEATFITDYTYNAGSLKGLNQFIFKAEQAVNTGVLEGDNVNITINHLSQGGELSLHNGQAKIAECIDTKDARTKYTDMLVTGDNFDSSGHLDAERTQFIYTDKFQTKVGSTFNTKQVVIQAHEFSHGGQLDYQERLLIEADKGTLEKGSVVGGKQTAEEELFVPIAQEENKAAGDSMLPMSSESSSEPAAGSTESEVKKEFKPNHILQLHVGEKLILDGKISGGDYTQIQGKIAESIESTVDGSVESAENKETLVSKCEALIVGDNADIQLVHGSIDIQQMENHGQVNLSKFSLDIAQLEQQKSMTLDGCVGEITVFNDIDTADTGIRDSSVHGDRFRVNGELDSKDTRYDSTTEFCTEETSRVKTNHVEIITGQFEHGGQLAHENGLSITADSAHLKKGSVVGGKQTAEEELFVPIAQEESKVAGDLMLPASSESSSEPAAESTEGEVKKEFKPNHILQFHVGEKLILDGKISGGDYTQIQGKTAESIESTVDGSVESAENKETLVSKCEALIVGDNADIQLVHGSIDIQQMENHGQVNLSKFSLDIAQLEQQKSMTLDGCVGEITVFNDIDTADTGIRDSSVHGDRFRVNGELDSKDTRYDSTTEFCTEETSRVKTNHVEIITGQFEHGGQLAHENGLSITADSAHLKKGSVVGGKQTAEEELFVPIAQSAAEPTEGEIKKEFKPNHIFTLEARNVVLDGVIKGGDYTSIHGKFIDKTSEGSESPAPTVDKCESLVVGESAEIDLFYGSIASGKADILAHVHLKSFDVDIGTTQLHQGGKLALENSVYRGDVLNSDGILDLNGSEVTLTQQMNLSYLSREIIKDSNIIATTVIDNSQFSYQGRADIFTDHYEHGGRITNLSSPTGNADENLFYVKTKTADLYGSSDIDNAIFSIDHFADGSRFVSGLSQYSNYGVSGGLMLETQDYMSLDFPFYRDCDLTVKASGITMSADYNKARDLTLVSTAGDISLLSDIASNNLYVRSAGSIRNNHNIYSNGVASFEAAGGFYNLGGVVNANTIAINASEIKNISAGSYATGVDWGASMGGAGIINGRTDAYLEATTGNIENYGGMIRSGNYTQLLAKGSVINACNIRTYRGAYDWITEYDGGLIAGGSGSGNPDGIGLYIKADGKVYSDASNFISEGINYIEGDQGIEFSARQESHISKIKKTKTWYGKTTRHVTTTTTVTNSVVHSAMGQNILVTEHGGVQSVATRFSSPAGTQIYARDNVELYSLTSQFSDYKSTSSFWGLSKHSKLQTHQESTPTLFIDNGVTCIYSSEGSIDARGAYFTGAGDLDLRAKGRIKFGVDLLGHEVVEKTRGVGISVPGMGAWEAWKNSGSLMDVITSADATVAKLNSMLNSNNATELLANSANLGVNLYNTTNSTMRGLANDTLGNELLSRYGLGGASGFSPTINLSMTQSETTARYQTQGFGGVDRGGNVYLEAGEGIDLENGVRVHAGGNMMVNAPELIAKAAELHSSIEQKMTTQSVGVSLTGQVQDASLGYSHNSTQTTSYANAELSADGNLTLNYQGGTMHRVVLDGARIDAGTLDARIEKLEIIDKQDITVTKNESVNVSLSGQISAYKGEGNSAITAQHSGIHVVDGINTNGHSVHIDEAYMRGGEIVTEGENKIQIDKLVTEKVVDHKSYTGIGISLNINDLQRLTGQKATNEAGEQAIAIAEATFDKVDYKAEQTSVIYGVQGTHADIKELVGELHTESADGAHIIKNDVLHVTLDIPVTNADYIEKSRENIQTGLEKIAVALGQHDLPETELPLRDEKTLPSRRNEEEEEEEEEEEIDSSIEKDKFDKEKAIEENVSLTVEEKKAVLDAAFSNMSEEKQDLINRLSIKLKKAHDKGEIDQATENELRQNIQSAIIDVIKTASEDSWSSISKQLSRETAKKLTNETLSKLSVKTYFGSKGLLITFTSNLFSHSVNKDEDSNILKKAAISTGGDIGFGIFLKYTTASLAGPLNWTFVGLGIVDSFLYDKHAIDNLYIDGYNTIREGRKLHEGSLQFIGSLQSETAAKAQAAHFWMTLPEQFGNVVKYTWNQVNNRWNNIRGKSCEPEIATTLPPVINRNSFFQPEEQPAAKKKESVIGESYTQNKP